MSFRIFFISVFREYIAPSILYEPNLMKSGAKKVLYVINL